MEENPDNAALEQATPPARPLAARRCPVHADPRARPGGRARAAERWPGWWAAELFGPPHREADVPVLADLHEGLRRLKLMRRRGRALYTTPRGRQLAAGPVALLQVLTADLGGGDAFTEMVAGEVLARLSGPPCGYEDPVAPALRRARQGGWRGPEVEVPEERELSWWSATSSAAVKPTGNPARARSVAPARRPPPVRVDGSRTLGGGP